MQVFDRINIRLITTQDKNHDSRDVPDKINRNHRMISMSRKIEKKMNGLYY